MPRGRPSRATIHARLAEQVAELRARHGGLPSPEEAEAIWTDIWYQEAHHSTAIEGNTLVLRQVEVLLREGRAVGDKELREYLEVQGYADAAKWVYSQALTPGEWSNSALLSMSEVRYVHELMIGQAWKVAPHREANGQERPGQWRQHDIRPFSSGMQPPSWTEIQAQMTDWLVEVNALRPSDTDAAPNRLYRAREFTPPRNISVLVAAEGSRRVLDARKDRIEGGPTETAQQPAIAQSVARVHAAFERIHPFLDGNGRTGRLLTNLMLVRLGYPPVVIQKRDRSRYLTALDRADRGDIGPLGELFARAVLDNLNKFILPAVAGPSKLIPLEALATPKLKVTTLRKAIERGRLRAIRAPNGSWRSSRQWVDEWYASRWSRGTQTTASKHPAAGAAPAQRP